MTLAVRLALLLTLLSLFRLALRYIPFVLPSYGFYAATIVFALAAAAVISPMPRLWLPSRPTAVLVLAASAAIAVLMVCWPPTRQRTASTDSLIDGVLPEYDCEEHHATTVSAKPDEAWRALTAVTFQDVPVFVPFMRARLAVVGRLRTNAPPPARPILDAMMSPGSGFVVLAERPGEEIVLGMTGRPWATTRPPTVEGLDAFQRFSTPASVRMAFNVRVHAVPQGTRITTETRIIGTDVNGTRAFGRYWRVVYPGSAVLRQAWLDAAARRLNP